MYPGKVYSMDQGDDVNTAYDNHPYEDKMMMVRMLIKKLVKGVCELLQHTRWSGNIKKFDNSHANMHLVAYDAEGELT